MSASACGHRGVDDVGFSGVTLLAARSGGHRLRVAGSASFDAPFWNALRRRPCPSILYTPGDHRRQHCCINMRNPLPTIYLTCKLHPVVPTFHPPSATISPRQARHRTQPRDPRNNPIPNNPANLLPNTPIPCPSRPQGDTGTAGQALAGNGGERRTDQNSTGHEHDTTGQGKHGVPVVAGPPGSVGGARVARRLPVVSAPPGDSAIQARKRLPLTAIALIT